MLPERKTVAITAKLPPGAPRYSFSHEPISSQAGEEEQAGTFLLGIALVYRLLLVAEPLRTFHGGCLRACAAVLAQDGSGFLRPLGGLL